jgi:hypothetical protein
VATLEFKNVGEGQTVLGEETEQHDEGVCRFILAVRISAFLRCPLGHRKKRDDAPEVFLADIPRHVGTPGTPRPV